MARKQSRNGKASGVNNKIKCSPSARTEEQKEVLRSIAKNDITIIYGPAGCGKTHICSMWGLHELFKGTFDQIILTRPAVEAYGEKLGYLPGDMEEKFAPYMCPIMHFFLKTIDQNLLNKLIKEDKIISLPLAYQRGINMDKAFVLADEFQNTIPAQVRMLLTRIGEGSKICITGDLRQSDLGNQINGLSDAICRLEGVDGIGICQLTEESIIRHSIIQKIEERYKEE